MWPQTSRERHFDHNITNNCEMESKTRKHIATSDREEQVSSLWDGVISWRGLSWWGGGGALIVENKFW